MFEKLVFNSKLLFGEALVKQWRNLEYLKSLETDNLLFPFRFEAGTMWSINRKVPTLHGGWDSQNSHLRGTFTGHWISASSYLVNELKDLELKGKLEIVINEIRQAQNHNGNGWCFGIPEKYLLGVREKKAFWAPIYVCHKLLMGLLDAYKFTDNRVAMDIINDCGLWFEKFVGETSDEQLEDMMDRQETGGIVELWADIYAETKNELYLNLMKRFERRKLYDSIYNNEDVLTNMHANIQIPEIHGAARAYEVTKEEKYRKIVENYWDLAVTRRGSFATGGQTCGEVWTPINVQATRLGMRNQEHCVVYNMIRLADYLYRWTGKTEYADYIERNIINGIFAQGYWEEGLAENDVIPQRPLKGLITYFLPLQAGGQKSWGSKTEHFWCCHCTLVQANTKFREYIYFKSENTIKVAQYIPSFIELEMDKKLVTITQTNTDLGGSHLKVNDIAIKGIKKPNYWALDFQVKNEENAEFNMDFRIPWWVSGAVECFINNEKNFFEVKNGYLIVPIREKECKIQLIFPKKITCWPLADEPETVAFLDGPVLLAGITENEKMLFGDINRPEEFIKPHCEREWSIWRSDYKVFNQLEGMYLKPLNQIGYEKYTVYFPIRTFKNYFGK